jgi:large subunit ribosomal protein L13
VKLISYRTKSANKNTVTKKWVLMDAEGKVLGRLASKVASIIRGLHKPDFTPHVDCGDNVIIINASKVHLTGRKWQNKKYISYSGYPGGQKSTSPSVLVKKKPERIVELAVKGMLPKNKLRLFSNLYVYPEGDHPHHAQQPEKINL